MIDKPNVEKLNYPKLNVALQRSNLRAVLRILRQVGPQSRADLAKLTNLSAPAAANIISELQALGIVKEGGRQKTKRGQPPISIELLENGAFATGIQINLGSYQAVAVNILGNIVATKTGVIESASQINWVEFVSNIHFDLVEKIGADRFLGLGLITPGPFDIPWPGIPTPGAIKELQTRSIGATISEKIKLPVYIENDASAAAYGEKLHGIAAGRKNYFYIYIGEGVGSGIIANRAIYRGDKGNAGEFGHITVNPNGPKCYCGNNGCLGLYVSMQNRNIALARATEHGQSLAVAELNWLTEAANALSIGISIVENLLEPEVIILGGLAPQEILMGLKDRLKTLRPSLRDGVGGERILLSTLCEMGLARAAAALPILASS